MRSEEFAAGPARGAAASEDGAENIAFIPEKKLPSLVAHEHLVTAKKRIRVAFLRRAANALEDTIDLGRELIATKPLLPHGSFLSHIERDCGVPKRTAQVAMQIARYWESLPEGKAKTLRFWPVSAVMAEMRGDKPVKSKPRSTIIDLQPDPPAPFDLEKMPEAARALAKLAEVHVEHPAVAAKLYEAARLLRDSIASKEAETAKPKPSKPPAQFAVPIKRHAATDDEQRALQLSQLPACDLALAKRLNPSLSTHEVVA
jgi:hypothetical protein